MDIVFVRTRRHIPSYNDFWALVGLSQFETCYVDEVDITKPMVYIASPILGDWDAHVGSQVGQVHRAHLVDWCLESPTQSESVTEYARNHGSRVDSRTLDEVWVCDRALASETGFRFVIMGSDYGLGEPSDVKHYDFCHMSYETPRRSHIYNQFDQAVVGPNRWPESTDPTRDYVLRHSRFGLSIHQWPHPYRDSTRWPLLAAYGLPMLAEAVTDAWPWTEEYGVFHPYEGIQDRLRQMLAEDYQRWWDMGQRTRDRMCGEFSFRKMVLAGVQESRSPGELR